MTSPNAESSLNADRTIYIRDSLNNHSILFFICSLGLVTIIFLWFYLLGVLENCLINFYNKKTWHVFLLILLTKCTSIFCWMVCLKLRINCECTSVLFYKLCKIFLLDFLKIKFIFFMTSPVVHPILEWHQLSIKAQTDNIFFYHHVL